MEIHAPSRDKTNFSSREYLHLNSCGTQSSRGRAFTTLRPAGRVDYHVLYVAEGTMTAEYGGASRKLNAGDFVVYEPHERQCYSFPKGEEARSCWLHFTGTAAQEIMLSLRLTGGVYRAQPDALILQTFERLICMDKAAPADAAVQNGTLLILLGFLARRAFDGGAAYAEAIAPAIRLMRSEYSRQVTVRECAALCRMSESRFQHMFREAAGVSPHRFLLSVRIDAAKELLSHTGLRVSDAAALCGFEDPLYFSRIFRRETGVSPREWRRAGGSAQGEAASASLAHTDAP